MIESKLRLLPIRVSSGNVPGTGHPTTSHDGFGALLVSKGRCRLRYLLLFSAWAVACTTFRCLCINHQDSLHDPIGGQCCPLPPCYSQSILVCSVHFCSRRVKAEHGKELSVQISWHRGQPPHFIPCLPRHALRGLATRSVPSPPLALVCMALRLPGRLELVVPRGLATWEGTGKIPSLLYI